MAVEGVRQHLTNRNDPWHLSLVVGLDAWTATETRELQPDGLICPWKLLRRTTRRHLPRHVVTYGGKSQFPDVPWAIRDPDAIGRQAAEYLMGIGLRQLLVFVPGDDAFVSESAPAFIQTSHDAGVPVASFVEGPRVRRYGWSLMRQRQDLAELLERLPGPIGVYACDDVHGDRAIAAAQHAGLRVPEDVAVLASTRNDSFCELCQPPMSSIVADPRRVGRRVAELMEQLLQGEQPAPEDSLVPPIGVAERESSNLLAVRDPQIAVAVRFIQDNFHKSIWIDDVVAQVPMSRSTLIRRFAKAIGRSPAQEIRRVRVRAAKRLLMQSGLTLQQIASACGYADVPQVCRAIRDDTGLTPTQYRERYATIGGAE